MNEPQPQDPTLDPTLRRVDLHCHSRFSVFKYFRKANTRDCYSAPEDVYRLAKERGMSFVTLTDHDSIDGALYLLNKHPDLSDFFISEEIETYFPETGQRVHIGAWDIDEEQHREIQRLRGNIRELVPYLKSENITFGVNHLFQSYRMKNIAAQYIGEMIEMFDIYEVLNGAMASVHNKMVQQLAATVRSEGREIAMVGGSDAHTLKHVSKVYTAAKGDDYREFLQSVKRGECFAWGEEMRFRELVTDIYLLLLAYSGQAGSDFRSRDYTGTEKLVQLLGRLAAIPVAASGLPVAITSLNYVKQIVVSKGFEMNFERVLTMIRERNARERENQNANATPPT